MMLLTTAFAAGDVPLARAGQQDQTLVFAVKLPDEYSVDQMGDAVADKVQAVLNARLAALEITGATVTIDEGRKSVTVVLPPDVPAEQVAAYLSRSGVVTVADTAGNTVLTAEDITGAAFAEGTGVTLTLAANTDKTEALAQAEALTVRIDGEAFTTADYAAESGTLTLAETDADGAQVAAFLNAGALPVTLTQGAAPTEPEQPVETEDAEDPAEETPAPEEEPTEPAEEPAEPVFPDIAGHWAESALREGVSHGLLSGIDGKMLPDNAVKRAETVVILNRTLGASIADSTSGLDNVPRNAWYVSDLGKAIHLGLIPADDTRRFDVAASRAEAFEMIARAFVYDRVEVADNALAAFTDTGSMTPSQRNAAAALVSAGIVGGKTATTLAPDAALTRAEFVTILMRVDGLFSEDPQSGGAIPVGGTAVELTDLAGSRDYIFGCAVSEVTLRGGATGGRVVLKGMEGASLTANGTNIGLLALDAAGKVTASLTNGASAETLVIAGRSGAVSFAGAADDIEITASNRTIDLTGMTANTLTVTGSNNTILLDGAVESVTVTAGAKYNKLTFQRDVGMMLVAGIGTKIDGRGKAEEIDVRAVNCDITLETNAKTENIDAGLNGVGIRINAPQKVLPGGSLVTEVSFTGVTEPKTCVAQWYEDGKPLAGYRNDSFALHEGKTTGYTRFFTFTRDMKTTITVGFRLTYENPSTGGVEEVYEEVTVPIENYSAEWYYQRDVGRVLGLVSSTYRGNFTTQYAIDNDYKPYEKEVWINAKGYSSSTKYLCWINRAYQHVNVFEGSKGNWRLIKSFLVGTGAMSSPTPTGVTTVSYKLKSGWTTGSYTVRPVVGFYPGSGYAFHSRLCYPGTDREYDFSAGYPVSHGCIRMYKNDIQWIFDNIPVGTTVVIH